MHSLQSKLGTGLVLSLITAFSILWLLINSSIQFLAEEYIASRLRHDAETLLSTIQFNADNMLTVNEKAIDLAYHNPFSGHYYQITTSDDAKHSRSLWDQHLNSTKVRTGEISRDYQAGPDGQSLLVLHNGFSKQGHRLTVTVAEDLNPVRQNISRFQTRFALSAIVMLLVLVVLQVFILRHSLSSLTRLRAELQALQRGELEQLHTDVPAELQPLASEINHLHQVMEQQLRRSRDALGDLAHAIKKPLTVIQQISNTHRQTLSEEAYEMLTMQTAEINRLTDRILKRARLAGHRHSATRFSLSHDLADLISTLKLMYSDKNIVLVNAIDESVQLQFDREDMIELIGNLLDNACKWASQQVSISLHIDTGTSLNIAIEDDGPGVEPDKRQQLVKRGVRLDESIEGHGIGLAITADIVAQYNGSLVFGQSDQFGGFRVDVTLPKAVRDQSGRGA